MPPALPFILSTLHDTDPAKFRQYLRVSPRTFDQLVEAVEGDRKFQNNARNEQMPVTYQVAIVLYRFGHYGNAVSLDKVASWAGVGKGTVNEVTRRVLTAFLRKSFRDAALGMPTAEEKEEAKQWVEEHSCHAWREGWCMVDGTLVPLYHRPYWFGESYFDRKCRYSLNFQASSDLL
ncbi:hypothetical protein SCHPADRAFT_947717 [Schizopora paradoxa]|uniref:DDE Tnp4 domain-containing protein n=1 Tax=Schizopora paradoxa TaxID=27342 RepID=A0A0H2RHX7_9AGAM|nr:hypothetical protein SCHPADRAFT_947717 [Schizopora paradoxa]